MRHRPTEFEPPITPALVLDLDAVDHNVSVVVSRAGGPERWRPHVKTVKCAAVVERLLRAGVRSFKVATVVELGLVLVSAVRASARVDVLVAYPLYGAALDAAVDLAAGHPDARVSLLADGPGHLEMLRPRGLPVFLDVDLGMGRTGSCPDAWFGVDARGVVGLHGYDGHLAWSDRVAAHDGYDALCDLADSICVSGLDVVTSGSHSYAHALCHERLQRGPWRAQISAGTIVFSDMLSAPAAEDLGLQQAAWVAARAVSVRGARVTLDAGSKALSPDVRPAGVAPAFPGWLWEAPSEEHQPCHGEGVGAGDLVWLMPAHVCTTVNLYREAWLLRAGEVVGRTPIDASGRCLVL